MTGFLLLAGALIAAPPLIFTAAVLLDHIIHGPNR